TRAITRDVIEHVRDVYFVDRIARNGDEHLEQNPLTGTRTKAARAARNALVDSLGPWSELLADAFGVPSEITSVNLMQRYEDMVTKAESDPAVGQPGRWRED